MIRRQLLIEIWLTMWFWSIWSVFHQLQVYKHRKDNNKSYKTTKETSQCFSIGAFPTTLKITWDCGENSHCPLDKKLTSVSFCSLQACYPSWRVYYQSTKQQRIEDSFQPTTHCCSNSREVSSHNLQPAVTNHRVIEAAVDMAGNFSLSHARFCKQKFDTDRRKHYHQRNARSNCTSHCEFEWINHEIVKRASVWPVPQ